MQFYETTIKLSKSDHDYIYSLVESGEFHSVSDFIASLISQQRDQIVETESPQLIEMVRERYENSFHEPGRYISDERLLAEFMERAKKNGTLQNS